MSVKLPKWPQMIVTGEPVTADQAKDIIFRTDSFLTDPWEHAGGNDRHFTKLYRELSGLNTIEWEDTTALRNKIGFIYTEYVTNDWGSCSFIYGAHGWCHPDGKIFFQDNVGKWPSVEEILDDWTRVAEAFPYLDLTVTLMSGESCEFGESVPLQNIRVKSGVATLEEPDLNAHGDRLKSIKMEREFANSVFDPNYEPRVFEYREFVDGEFKEYEMEVSREVGLPFDWYVDYAKTIKAIINDKS